MLKYDTIKEDRGDYYIEYIPLFRQSYAFLNLIFLHEYETAKVADIMEQELDTWLSRFPIPTIVFSFDNKEDNISVESVRPCNFIIGFIDPVTKKRSKHWQLVSDEIFPKEQLEDSYILNIYKDLPSQTLEEIGAQNKKGQLIKKRIGRAWSIIALYTLTPLIMVYFLGLASPVFGLLVFLYSLWIGVKKYLKITGRWRKSKKEVQKEHENTKVKHHHYHCEKNPEGFRKLRAENIEQDAINRNQREVEGLRSIQQ